MRLKDLSIEKLKTLSDFGGTEYYKVLREWIVEHELHHAGMALTDASQGIINDDELKRKLVYRAGRLEEGKKILALPEQAKKLYISIKKTKDAAK